MTLGKLFLSVLTSFLLFSCQNSLLEGVEVVNRPKEAVIKDLFEKKLLQLRNKDTLFIHPSFPDNPGTISFNRALLYDMPEALSFHIEFLGDSIRFKNANYAWPGAPYEDESKLISHFILKEYGNGEINPTGITWKNDYIRSILDTGAAVVLQNTTDVDRRVSTRFSVYSNDFSEKTIKYQDSVTSTLTPNDYLNFDRNGYPYISYYEDAWGNQRPMLEVPYKTPYREDPFDKRSISGVQFQLKILNKFNRVLAESIVYDYMFDESLYQPVVTRILPGSSITLRIGLTDEYQAQNIRKALDEYNIKTEIDVKSILFGNGETLN